MEQSVFNYTEHYKVRSYETDADACASVQTIVNYLQNTGFNHALILNKSGNLASDPSIAYFLTRQRVRILRYPRWKESLTINTWLETRILKYAVREFEIIDGNGNILASATNSALFYNLKEKRVIPASECLIEFPEPSRERVLDDPFESIPRVLNAEYKAEFPVRLADIDMYKHVNNVVYVEWAVETLPASVREGRILYDHEINFRTEAGPGDTVIAVAEEVTDGLTRIFLHRLSRKSDGGEVALLRTWWIPKKA
jgi:acyl-ACP thioesterase